MKLIITDSIKAEQFTVMFHYLSQLADIVMIYFEDEKIYAQGMDNSHVCLFNFQLMSDWFDEYEFKKGDISNIALKTSRLYKVINTKEQNQSITLSYDGHPNSLSMAFESDNKQEYNKYFELYLIDLEQDLLNIDNYESQVDMTFPSKKYANFINELEMFNDTVNIQCTEDQIIFRAQGDEGLMKVDMDINDLIEYGIEEGGVLNETFSLSKLNLMCQFHKLSKEVIIGFCEDQPMEMLYNLDNVERDNEEEENKIKNFMKFYLAPKILDE
jgi:proliferating cell nuclear antigen PCNA